MDLQRAVNALVETLADNPAEIRTITDTLIGYQTIRVILDAALTTELTKRQLAGIFAMGFWLGQQTNR